jgi:hypothetical protein
VWTSLAFNLEAARLYAIDMLEQIRQMPPRFGTLVESDVPPVIGPEAEEAMRRSAWERAAMGMVAVAFVTREVDGLAEAQSQWQRVYSGAGIAWQFFREEAPARAWLQQQIERVPRSRGLSRSLCLALLALLMLARSLPAAAAGERLPMAIRFDALSPVEGLRLSVSTRGDHDGSTTFSNTVCCGIDSAQGYIRDVRIYAGDKPLAVRQEGGGWTVRHAPDAPLRVSYRLPPTGPMLIDVGVPEQLRPIVEKNSFHVVGTFGLLLPMGRGRAAPITLDVDATQVADDAHFVSSFGSGNRLRGVQTTLGKASKAIYLGGAIRVSLHDTPTGKVAIAYSGMDAGFQPAVFSADTLAILAAERAFFRDRQDWYLVSLHGGRRQDPVINLGGGMGLTNSFAMFAWSGLDGRSEQHREQVRWVLAHEYFHNWNGLTLRVASRADGKGDDTSVYWFSEGVTEFYTMRVLTRMGLQAPARSLRVLNDKLERYAANSRRDVGAQAAGDLFWSDADGEQIPYLRGYLAAWAADLALRRNSGGKRGLDDSLRALVARGEAQEDFRVDNRFLVSYLSQGMSARDAARFSRFVLRGGDAPLDVDSLAPCLVGERKRLAKATALQFAFAKATNAACFRH